MSIDAAWGLLAVGHHDVYHKLISMTAESVPAAFKLRLAFFGGLNGSRGYEIRHNRTVLRSIEYCIDQDVTLAGLV